MCNNVYANTNSVRKSWRSDVLHHPAWMGGITRVGPGRNPQYTCAHSGGEAVGCSQCHVTSSSRMVAEPAVPRSTGREPRPSHQNQQWTVQLCNTASFPPAAQAVLKTVEIRKNRVQKTARGTQVKLINEVDTTRSRRGIQRTQSCRPWWSTLTGLMTRAFPRS